MGIIGHLRGQKCPRCDKKAYCDDCALCESCEFAAPWMDNTYEDVSWPEKLPQCEECGETLAHARECSVTRRAAKS